MDAEDVCIHPANVLNGERTLTGFKGIGIFPRPGKNILN